MTAAKKVLAVLGGTGFIGRCVVRTALESGWAVRAFGRNIQALERLRHPDLTVHRVDVSVAPVTADQLKGTDVVCNLVAFIPPDHSSSSHAAECFQINAVGVVPVMEAARAAGVAHVVHISAGTVYPVSGEPAGEDTLAYPSSRAAYYLTSKLAGEILVEHHRTVHRQSVTSLRVSSVYGPGTSSGMVATFASRLLAGTPITLHDGGRHAADLVYVGDVAAAVMAAAERRPQGIINVGSGRAVSALDVATILAGLIGADESLVVIEPTSSSQPASPGFPALNLHRARALLAYAPTSIEDGLSRYLRSLEASVRAASAP